MKEAETPKEDNKKIKKKKEKSEREREMVKFILEMGCISMQMMMHTQTQDRW